MTHVKTAIRAAAIFDIGLYKIEGSQRFTSSPATYNGIKGRIWTKWIHTDGLYLHAGKQHVRAAASEVEVTAAFDNTGE